MSFTYPTVSIGSHSYSVYADEEQADLYLDAVITSAAVAWRDATADTKKRALVSSTLWLDAAVWQGTMTDADQERAFPRKDIPEVDSASLPLGLVNGSIELAALLVDDPDARANLSRPLVREQHAGPAGQSFFRPDSVQVTSPFPAVVMAYISLWLSASDNSAGGPLAYGTGGKPKLKRYDFRHGF